MAVSRRSRPLSRAAEQRADDAVVGTAEVRVIQDVEELRSETKPYLLGYRKLPLQRNIRLPGSETSQDVPPEITLLPNGRRRTRGISGMREWAERIGGRINITSRNTAVTEVDLSVPGKVAFPVEPSRSRIWLAKFIGKTPEGVRRAPGRDHR